MFMAMFLDVFVNSIVNVLVCMLVFMNVFVSESMLVFAAVDVNVRSPPTHGRKTAAKIKYNAPPRSKSLQYVLYARTAKTYRTNSRLDERPPEQPYRYKIRRNTTRTYHTNLKSDTRRPPPTQDQTTTHPKLPETRDNHTRAMLHAGPPEHTVQI